MKIEELVKNVFEARFEIQEELASTFLRFVEYYQNPVFMGRFFTLDEFKVWYVANSPKGKKTGKFTYYSDWDGFSVPSYVLDTFYNGKFNPLSSPEHNLLDIFKDRRGSNFYIIGTFKNISLATKKHEIAHGLFHTNSDYRERVLVIMAEMNLEDRKKINDFLSNYNGGYHPDFFDEEGHAYLIDRRCLGANGIISDGLNIASRELKKVFKRFYPID